MCYGAWKGAQRKGVETLEVAQKCLIHVMKWKEEQKEYDIRRQTEDG